MKCLVTGVAGFIGSSLAERLIKDGHKVIGIDCFTPYYSEEIKRNNIKELENNPNFYFLKEDISQLGRDDGTTTSERVLFDIDVVFHQAAQPGVRDSWDEFDTYVMHNVLATKCFLDFCSKLELKKFIYASSSSVYGDADKLPVNEQSSLRPVSPYGVTKLAAENLCYSYFKNYNIPVISLRYFTVYGPKQRPDMAIHKFIKAILNDEEIIIYGDGLQLRDFTYIEDIVDANLLAVECVHIGQVFNIGGGINISLLKVTYEIEKLLDKKANFKFIESQRGDVKETLADIDKANIFLNYRPKWAFKDGLKKEIDWIKGEVNHE